VGKKKINLQKKKKTKPYHNGSGIRRKERTRRGKVNSPRISTRERGAEKRTQARKKGEIQPFK